MQFWLLLFEAVACVALSGATLQANVSDEKTLVNADIHKRQLAAARAAFVGAPIFNAAATLKNLVCGVGISFLEDRLENLNIPSFSKSGLKISSIDVKRVDIGQCDVNLRGGVTNPRVRISLSDIYLEVTGRYRKKVLFVTFKGKWEVKIRNARLDVDATLAVDLSRRRITRITVNSCSDDFTNVSVRFHGSFSAIIINLFRRRISRELSKRVENKVCEVGEPFLENELLQRYPNIG